MVSKLLFLAFDLAAAPLDARAQDLNTMPCSPHRGCIYNQRRRAVHHLVSATTTIAWTCVTPPRGAPNPPLTNRSHSIHHHNIRHAFQRVLRRHLSTPRSLSVVRRAIQPPTYVSDTPSLTRNSTLETILVGPAVVRSWRAAHCCTLLSSTVTVAGFCVATLGESWVWIVDLLNSNRHVPSQHLFLALPMTLKPTSPVSEAANQLPIPSESPLLKLPTELLCDIISYYRDPFTFGSPLMRQEHGLQERQDRRQILRSLSQSCSRHRAIFLPLLWERLHAAEAKFQRQPTESELTTLIFPYIKSVHVSLQHAKMETIFAMLEFLGALPNLTALQIYQLKADVMLIMMYAFKGAVFPAVTALCVPDSSASAISSSFPNVTSFACPSIYDRSMALAHAKIHFPDLEALTGLRLSKGLIDILLRDFPNLRAISVSSLIGAESTGLLSRLKRFRRLARLSLVHEDPSVLSLSLEALISSGAEVLRASQSPEPKVLTVWSYNMYEGFDPFPHVVSVATE
ncbi:hypothetical protein FB451DRAFT_1495122 [Mycena latifolia]|nr:hypothetical protein FB451DRAFT_1495122 [Mycena latifolia]